MKKVLILLGFFIVACGGFSEETTVEDTIIVQDKSQLFNNVVTNYEIIDILKPDENYDSRAYASIIKVDSEYIIFYSATTNNEYSIFRNSSNDLETFDNKNEIQIIPNITNAYNFQHVYVPYVFYENDMYYMILTSRKYNEDRFEAIHIATSKDSFEWEINLEPILIPEYQWEGNEVENFGVIKVDDTYFLNFESTGPTKSQAERSIGIAYSNDLANWKKISDTPQIVDKKFDEGVYCASFFTYNNEIYLIVPNLYRFKIYKFTDFNNLSEDDFIGYFVPYDRSKNIVIDTPEVITNDINKEVFLNEKFYLAFSSTRYGGWNVEGIVFRDVNEFINQLQK